MSLNSFPQIKAKAFDYRKWFNSLFFMKPASISTFSRDFHKNLEKKLVLNLISFKFRSIALFIINFFNPMNKFVHSQIIKSPPDESLAKSLSMVDPYKCICRRLILPNTSINGGIYGVHLPNKGKNQPIAERLPLKQGLKQHEVKIHDMNLQNCRTASIKTRIET